MTRGSGASLGGAELTAPLAGGKPIPSLEAKDGALASCSAALRGGSGVGGMTPREGTDEWDGSWGDKFDEVGLSVLSEDPADGPEVVLLENGGGGVAGLTDGKANGNDETGGSFESVLVPNDSLGGGANGKTGAVEAEDPVDSVAEASFAFASVGSTTAGAAADSAGEDWTEISEQCETQGHWTNWLRLSWRTTERAKAKAIRNVERRSRSFEELLFCRETLEVFCFRLLIFVIIFKAS